MLDHPAGRQAGELVVIGGAEQLVLERLLLGDVGRGRDQEIAAGDLDRPMRGEEHVPGRAAGQHFLEHHRTAAAQQVQARGVAIVGRRRLACARRELQLGRGRFIHQDELAMLVLTVTPAGSSLRRSRRMRNSFPEMSIVTSRCRARLKIVLGEIMHAPTLAKSVVVLVKRTCEMP